MADLKIAYGASSALTITLAALASSTGRLAGRESAAVDNTAGLHLDYLVAGRITTGTTPTDARIIEVWAYGQHEDTPSYPDVFDGTDSAETVTSDGIKAACLRLIAAIATDGTSNRTYPFGPVGLASLFGGPVPKRWGVFVTHDTGVNLNATAGNHAVWTTPIYATS